MEKQNVFPLVMKTAALCTAALTAAFIGLYAFLPNGVFLALAITAGTTCYHFSMRLLVGHIVPRLSRNADPSSRWFLQRPFETGLYRFLKVKQWKGKMPTYAPEQFSLAHNTLEGIISNMCTSELVHEVIILFSFLPLLLSGVFDSFWAFFITSLLSALVDAAFAIMQRYNRPRLVRLLKKQHTAKKHDGVHN